jgi:C1A family cysteine protease
VEGGHEVELIGVDARGWVIGMNSWGREWGVGGRFKLTFDDLNTLLADQGDAVVLVR